MSLHQTVQMAIKDKAPDLFKQLTEKGELALLLRHVIVLSWRSPIS